MSDLKLKSPLELEILKVIHTSTSVGQGTYEDPVKILHQYWSMDGVLLAEKEFKNQ